MSTAKIDHYFRTQARRNFADRNYLGMIGSSSSTESDEITQRLEDPRTLTLHVITDPGQSASINTSFQYLIGRLDSSLDVICVSERFKPLKPKENETPQDQGSKLLPSLALVLFFKDEFNIDPTAFTNSQLEVDNDIYHIRDFFSHSPWKFHHKVDVTGKLISCETNQQDYYEYACTNTQLPPNGRISPKDLHKNIPDPPMHFPLWGARKVHYGKQILRFNLFVSNENWKDQINFYKLLLRKEEIIVRDDFCYFEIFSTGNTAVQLGLKKLPASVKPQSLLSSILQFKVKNVGQLVPLLPHSCEPISELRWRTRDHDSNLVLLQIRRTRDLNAGASFVKKLFSDHDTSDCKEKVNKAKKARAHASNLQFKSKSISADQNISTPVPKERSSHPSHEMRSSEEPSIAELGDSFMCPSLPEKMPLIEPTIYFQTNSRNSSSISSSSSSTATSEYQSTRGTPPASRSETRINIQRSPNESIIFMTRKTSPNLSRAQNLSGKEKKASSQKPLTLSLTKEEGFYV